MPPKPKNKARPEIADELNRFRRAYGALSDDDGATEVELPMLHSDPPSHADWDIPRMVDQTGDVIGHFKWVGVILAVVVLAFAMHSCGGHPEFVFQ